MVRDKYSGCMYMFLDVFIFRVVWEVVDGI